MNARFYIMRGGEFVKLTLRPGQSVEVCEGGPTDEGYSWTVERYDYDGQFVTCCTAWEARDCDGRMSSHRESECHVLALRSRRVESEPDWPLLPEWRLLRRSRRDHTAEAAGY